MDTSATAPSNHQSESGVAPPSDASQDLKGKGKAKATGIAIEDAMDDEDEGDDDDEENDDDDDDGDEAEEEDEDMEDVETYDTIDPTVIQPRRTRGVRIDYSSPEAFSKAGLKPEDDDDDDN